MHGSYLRNSNTYNVTIYSKPKVRYVNKSEFHECFTTADDVYIKRTHKSKSNIYLKKYQYL